MRRRVARERPFEDRLHHFAREALTPAVLAHQPADLHVAGILRALAIDALQSAMPNQIAARLLDCEQEGEPFARVQFHGFGVLGFDLEQFARPAQMAHDRWRGEDAELRFSIPLADRTQDQPLGLEHDVRHRGFARRF